MDVMTTIGGMIGVALPF